MKNFDEIFEQFKYFTNETVLEHTLSDLSQKTKHILDFFLSKQLINLLEIASVESPQHFQRVGALSSALARQLGFSNTFVKQIGIAAQLHDIGKLGVPQSIILKNGTLDPEEWQAMERHTSIGGKLLSSHDFPILCMASDIALFHHERWDGLGYPHGLELEQIPVAARIVAICDCYDALTSKRAYKAAWPPVEAASYILREASKTYDPHFAKIFVDSILPSEQPTHSVAAIAPAEAALAYDRISNIS